jgi:hypothetical protein
MLFWKPYSLLITDNKGSGWLIPCETKKEDLELAFKEYVNPYEDIDRLDSIPGIATGFVHYLGGFFRLLPVKRATKVIVMLFDSANRIFLLTHKDIKVC